MKSSELFTKLSQICSDRELKLVERGIGHWQILGGPKMINWWPFSKRRTVHVKGEGSGRPWPGYSTEALYKLTDLVFS